MPFIRNQHICRLSRIPSVAHPGSTTEVVHERSEHVNTSDAMERECAAGLRRIKIAAAAIRGRRASRQLPWLSQNAQSHQVVPDELLRRPSGG